MDISFSGSEMAVITAMLGAVISALGILFRALLAAKDSQITVEREEKEMYRASLFRVLGTAERTATAAEAAAGLARKKVNEL